MPQCAINSLSGFDIVLCNCHTSHKFKAALVSNHTYAKDVVHSKVIIALELLTVATKGADKNNTNGKSHANTDDQIAVCCCNSTDLKLVHGASVEQMTAEVDPILILAPLYSPPVTLQRPWSMLATQTSALVCQLPQQLLRSPHFQSPTASAFQMSH